MTAIAEFRALHESGCFVIPNPWDAGSAFWLRKLGFKALATTSAGAAFSRGLPDAIGAMTLAATLDHVREIVAATPLPVSADFQEGFAAEPEGVAASVTACMATGVAGLSIEDATGRGGLFERAQAIERVRAARAAIGDSGVVLTARCEADLVKDPDADRIALDRLVAFAEAGADCVFAPMLPLALIPDAVRAVAPTAVNAIVTTPRVTVAQLAELGVRRISVGSALARVAWGAFLRSAREIAEAGTFESFAGAASFAELDAAFR
jgi:2-methylisocitrate lyase-like PEP mutase family enzyme